MKKDKTNGENIVTVKVPERISSPLKYKVLSDREINFTKEKAYEFLELETFPGERQVMERHVQTLYNQFCAGRFMWDHVMLATAKLGNKVYRINGQHTCWMRVNIPKDVDITVRHVEYQVPNEEELRALYCVFDRAKSRTPQHVIKASLTGLQASAELWPSVLGTLAAGFKLWKWEKARYECIEPSDLITMLEGEYNNLFRVVGVAWQELYEHIPMRKAAVIAAMFATFSVNVKKSLEFWGPIGTGLNLSEKTDARWQLRKYLDTHTQSLRTTGKPVSGEDIYRVCITAWNRWRKNEKILQGFKPSVKRIQPK